MMARFILAALMSILAFTASAGIPCSKYTTFFPKVFFDKLGPQPPLSELERQRLRDLWEKIRAQHLNQLFGDWNAFLFQCGWEKHSLWPSTSLERRLCDTAEEVAILQAAEAKVPLEPSMQFDPPNALYLRVHVTATEDAPWAVNMRVELSYYDLVRRGELGSTRRMGLSVLCHNSIIAAGTDLRKLEQEIIDRFENGILKDILNGYVSWKALSDKDSRAHRDPN